MNGWDLAKVQTVLEKAQAAGWQVVSRGPAIEVTTKSGRHFMFDSIEELYGFLCGHEWGYSKGEADSLEATHRVQEGLS